MIIGLDAGHGGRNRGACYGGLVERDLTLAVASRAADLLADSDIVTPYLIREEDIALRLKERGGIARRAGCSAVVSIHFNASANPARYGGALFYRRGDADGLSLGAAILNRLPERPYRKWPSDHRYKGELSHPGALLVTSAYSGPCALVELAYLTNAKDRAWVAKQESINELARAIRYGCEAWVRKMELDNE